MEEEQTVELLRILLASSVSIGIKAQNYHWNVTGPNFGEYHDFFGDYYKKVSAFVDLYAEHIRQLGMYAIGSLYRFAELTKITDEVSIPSAKFMMIRLESDNKIILECLKEVHSTAKAINELGLVATLEDAIRFHSKMQWMMESYENKG